MTMVSRALLIVVVVLFGILPRVATAQIYVLSSIDVLSGGSAVEGECETMGRVAHPKIQTSPFPIKEGAPSKLRLGGITIPRATGGPCSNDTRHVCFMIIAS